MHNYYLDRASSTSVVLTADNVLALRLGSGPNWAHKLMKKKFAKNHENTTVMHKNEPNLAKNTIMHKNSGTEASTEVAMPDRTEMPMFLSASRVRSTLTHHLETTTIMQTSEKIFTVPCFCLRHRV